MTGSLPPYLPDGQDRGSYVSAHAIDAHLPSAGVNAMNVADSAAHQAFKGDQDFHWRQFELINITAALILIVCQVCAGRMRPRRLLTIRFPLLPQGLNAILRWVPTIPHFRCNN
jgi:hypothetical protein